jgi:hypothetical protein
MALQHSSYKIRGVAPLLLQNGHLADPLNYYSRELKKISGKKPKTDADYEAMAKIEWYGSLYTENDKIVIPTSMIEAGIVTAAKKKKEGKIVLAGVFCEENAVLEFPHKHLSINELWLKEEYRFTCGVVIMGRRVMRTRPIFNNWWSEFKIVWDDQIVKNEEAIKGYITILGEQVGIGNWRPKYGRFEIVE